MSSGVAGTFVGDLIGIVLFLGFNSGWLARRLLTFGASEIHALMIALGDERPTDATPAYTVKLASKLFGLKAARRLPENSITLDSESR